MKLAEKYHWDSYKKDVYAVNSDLLWQVPMIPCGELRVIPKVKPLKVRFYWK